MLGVMDMGFETKCVTGNPCVIVMLYDKLIKGESIIHVVPNKIRFIACNQHNWSVTPHHYCHMV